MAIPVLDTLDLSQNDVINALLHPLGADPGSPADGQVWFRTDLDRLRIRAGGVTKSMAFEDDVPAGYVADVDFAAQSALIAVLNDTPVAITFAAGELLGRGVSGDLRALTPADARAALGVEANAAAAKTPSEQLADLITVDGAASGLDADLLDGLEGSAYATVAAAVLESDYNANTVLVAVADNTPLPITMGVATIVGRGVSGDTRALTGAEVRANIGVEPNATADQTPAEILAALLTVDGPASALDADLLDGQQGAYYAVEADVVNQGDYGANSILAATAVGTPVSLAVNANTLVGRAAAGGIDTLTAAEVRTILGIEAGSTADQTAAQILAALITVDGAASALDADLLDGQHGSYYATATDMALAATVVYVDAQISAVLDAAPAALDTLNELAAALGDDANFAGTMTTSLAAKTEKYAVDIGDGSLTTITVTHNLGTYDITTELYYTASKKTALATITRTSINACTVDFGTAPASGAVRFVGIG